MAYCNCGQSLLENDLASHFNNSSSRQGNEDNTLIIRICNADESALELLYHSYYQRLFRFIGRVTWQEDLIEEIINDVMYTVWEKAATYNHQCQLSTWIFGIAYNKARQTLRKANFFNEESLDEMDVDHLALGSLDAGMGQLEMSDWLSSGFAALSADQRAVVELTYFQGLHYSEIAELMGCPENTIKTRMHHARKILATQLKGYDNTFE
jgi:RNA polymerase sigma factor (sigma-70 family)